MHPAIRVDNLSKLYRIGARQDGYKTLRESVAEICTAPLHRLRQLSRATAKGASVNGNGRLMGENFWALKDVSFEVQPGEVVGIIGRNGAGKSTLLKILSRITEPTHGRVELRGRVGSLLEVGTGFHPELTGRENVYMNGSILGMSHREISRKFDEIVDFSGIEDFLDTPVKRYSSGMYVRLAFAVAAHLEPEILIVDEVLAVGDGEFQRKCLGRMEQVGNEGRTVLFVSHNMPAIERLCSRCFLFDAGRVKHVSHTVDVIAQYRTLALESTQLRDSRISRGETRYFKSASLQDDNGNTVSFLPLGTDFRLAISICADHPIRCPTIGVGVNDPTGYRLLTVHTPLMENPIVELNGMRTVLCRVPSFPLQPGIYTLKLALTAQSRELEAVDNALSFQVIDANTPGEGRGFHKGVCVARSEWSLIGAN